MVNRVVLKYFREHRAGHSMEDLKGAVLEGGYSQVDIDEAVAFLNEKRELPEIVDNKVVEKKVVHESVEGRVSGRRWMRFAGILGVVFLGLGILNFVVGLIGFKIGSGPVLTWVILGVAIVLVVLSYFYFYGFLRMGRAVKSKLLKVAAVMNIVSVILLAVLVVVSVVLVWVMAGILSDTMSGGRLNAIASGAVVNGIMTGNAISGVSLGVSGGLGILILIFFVLLFLFVFASRLLISIALIRIGKNVRFANVAGILGLVAFGLGTIFSIISLRIFSSGAWVVDFMKWGGFGIFVLGLVMLFFESLSLFDGSKKFEG